MEDLLLNIVKEASGARFTNVKQAAQIAHDKLFRQHGIHRDPSYELRAVCFMALQMALETKRAKFITMGLNGLHRIIREERFYIGLEPEDDSLWLPAQLLRTTASLSPSSSGLSSNEETVVNVLRLFLAMACSPTCTLNGRLLIEILSRCGECWETGTRAVRAASLAAASQCLRAFCVFLKDETEEVLRTAPPGIISIAQASAVYNEVIPVMQWLCSRLIEPQIESPKKKGRTCGSLFLTESILTLVTALSRDVNANPHFTAFLWQKFCPTLAAALGSPGRVNLDIKFTYRDALHIIESETRGFFTGPGLDGPQARCIYLTSIQLVRIAGAQGSLRPMLEALFHRMLLLPAPQNRTEPLRCVREIFRSPERIVDLAVILYPVGQGQNCSDDMALFRLIIDAMEECATAATSTNTSNESTLYASIEGIVTLLASLQKLCSEEVDAATLSDQARDVINGRYVTLREVDYTGPLTYQSMARLPAPYRDAVAVLRQNGFESHSSASESECGECPDPAECGSNGSGDTEGPEEEEPHSSGDEPSFKVEGTWPYTHLQAPSPPSRLDSDRDRQHARDFAHALTVELVPKLLRLRSSVEVDESMQEFASAICQQNSMHFSDFDYNVTAINADGIYLATYSALLLSLQLNKSGHYEATDEPAALIPLSEQQFVTSVQNAGVLVYLSSAWLCELYQCVLAANPLEALHRTNASDWALPSMHCALIDMLADAGGLGVTQMLSDWQRLQSVTRIVTEPSERQLAARKLARRLLTCCWDSMVAVLSTALEDTTASATDRLKSTLRVRRRRSCSKASGEALYALSLEGLHAAATLSNSLNLQHLAGKILALIAANVCQTSGARISASQALSMDVVLTGGLILGSYSAECWAPVFAVCRHVTQLEHELFSSSQQMSIGQQVRDADADNKNKIGGGGGSGNDKLNLTSCPIDDDETCVDVYSFLQAPLQTPTTSVSVILKQCASASETILLNHVETAKILCALSHQADTLFSDAAERLNLPSLCQFLKCLCKTSRDQLYRNSANGSSRRPWWTPKVWKQRGLSIGDALPLSVLLHRVGDVTLRVFRSSRPLLHILKVWAITGPHLMDAACHRDRAISKRAIEYIHNIITALLVEQCELPHFHFNEALLKPFENLLSMETCDVDVQDQIVACLYEIVEAHRLEISSGWRPLFGTLRNARNRPLHIANVADIFRVFLDSDNTLVFANAGLDCILCLLSYLEITGTSSATDAEDLGAMRLTEFLHDTLKFLERCSSILAFMYSMPQCPNLHATYKIKGISYTHIIDANIPCSMENFTYFGNDYLQTMNEQHVISYRSLHIDREGLTKIDELDKPSGVLKVWFLLLDGLTNALIVCPAVHQAPILQTIFKLFRSLAAKPGLDFGLYSVNHLLIPMVQDWLRYANKTQKCWTTIEKNFKHCCGMTTDLVVDFIQQSSPAALKDTRKVTRIHRPLDPIQFAQLKRTGKLPEHPASPTQDGDNSGELSSAGLTPAATLALKQLLLVLVECSVQSQETIARVGVSCMKHIVLSTGDRFNEDQFMIACSAIHRACTVSLAPLRQMAFAFNECSNSFYGDCATVKVAARKDATIEELTRVYNLAQQVFLMDGQRDAVPLNKTVPIDDRSYSFLLFPIANGFTAGSIADSYVIRIPYRNLVIGLLVNQMLLQLIANLLVAELNCVPPEVQSAIHEAFSTATSINTPTFRLGFQSREILLRCVKQHMISSLEFDTRPGLKFLIQKVSNIENAANLYKQMTSSWMIYFVTLVDTYLTSIGDYKLSTIDLKYILESCSRVNTSTVKKKENFVRQLFALQDAWILVSELFLKENVATQADVDENVQSIKANAFLTSDTRTHSGAFVPDLLASDDDTNENCPNQTQRHETYAETQAQAEEVNVAVTAIHRPRTNPFNKLPLDTATENANQKVSPEIEAQRVASILRDTEYKRTSLTQLVVASMELMRSLPDNSAKHLEILLTPTIKEAFRLVELMQDKHAV